MCNQLYRVIRYGSILIPCYQIQQYTILRYQMWQYTYTTLLDTVVYYTTLLDTAVYLYHVTRYSSMLYRVIRYSSMLILYYQIRQYTILYYQMRQYTTPRCQMQQYIVLKLILYAIYYSARIAYLAAKCRQMPLNARNFFPNIKYLGFIISIDRIKADLKKTAIINQQELLRTIKGIQLFLGFYNFY